MICDRNNTKEGDIIKQRCDNTKLMKVIQLFNDETSLAYELFFRENVRLKYFLNWCEDMQGFVDKMKRYLQREAYIKKWAKSYEILVIGDCHGHDRASKLAEKLALLKQHSVEFSESLSVAFESANISMTEFGKAHKAISLKKKFIPHHANPKNKKHKRYF